MKRNKKRVLVAVLAICALAAGGAAFTAGLGNSFPSTATAGFAQTQISGAVATGVTWHISSDGQNVTSATMHLTSDGTTALDPATKVNAGFDATTPNGAGGTATLAPCAEDPANTGDATLWVCDFTSSPYSVANAHVFNVSVTDNNPAHIG
jgi:hypothetical protein